MNESKLSFPSRHFKNDYEMRLNEILLYMDVHHLTLNNNGRVINMENEILN